MGILQARILVRVAIPFSRGSSQLRDWTRVSHIAGRFFTIWATREARANKDWGIINCEGEVDQSCLTLCNPMDCSPPGSSVHGIFQARVLEWIAISFSRGPSWFRNWTRVSRIAGRRFTVGGIREALYKPWSGLISVLSIQVQDGGQMVWVCDIFEIHLYHLT